MTYPEKYPLGFVAAALQTEKPSEILLEGVRYYTDLLQGTINGFCAPDATLVIAALRIYANATVPETPDNGKLADMLVASIKNITITVKLPNPSAFDRE